MMRLKLLLWVFWICTVHGLCQTSTSLALDSLHGGALVVRLYMNKPLTDMLQKSIDDPEITAKEKERLQLKKDEHKADRRQYVENIVTAFEENYTYSKVYYLYDYHQRQLQGGQKKGLFLNPITKEIDPSIEMKENYFMIAGRYGTDDNVELFDSNAKRLPESFPSIYKANIFAVFSIVFSNSRLKVNIKGLNRLLHKKHGYSH